MRERERERERKRGENNRGRTRERERESGEMLRGALVIPLPSLLFFLSGSEGLVMGEHGRTARGFRTEAGKSEKRERKERVRPCSLTLLQK